MPTKISIVISTSQESFVMNNCPVCHNETLRPLFKSVDYSHTQEEFEVLICSSCSFKVTKDAPTADKIGPYYESEDYVSHSDTQKGLFFKVYHVVRNYMLGKKAKMLPSGGSSNELLDIGCGTGYFLNHMKGKGWNVLGLEQDAKARQYGKEKFSLDVRDPKELFKLELKKYTAVSMWHVLEHVHELDRYIESIKAILSDKGQFIVAVPNNDSLDAKHYGKYWAAWDLPIHLWHFNPKSMSVLMERHGFKIKAMKRLPFDSFYVSILSEKYKGGNSIMGMIWGGLSYLKAFFDRKKCSSVVYIMEKKQ